jgi:uncharacterized membrane protein (DUF373 family)
MAARTTEERLIYALQSFNRFLHLLLALALIVARLMVVWQFSVEVVQTLRSGAMARGFLHALGALFIVWTLSSLISAEVSYIERGYFRVRVFVEVTMITLLRQLIVAPVEVAAGTSRPEDVFNPSHYGLLLAALLVTGIVYWLVGDSTMSGGKAPGETGPA